MMPPHISTVFPDPQQAGDVECFCDECDDDHCECECHIHDPYNPKFPEEST